jgi:hypothetical protein
MDTCALALLNELWRCRYFVVRRQVGVLGDEPVQQLSPSVSYGDPSRGIERRWVPNSFGP